MVSMGGTGQGKMGKLACLGVDSILTGCVGDVKGFRAWPWSRVRNGAIFCEC